MPNISSTQRYCWVEQLIVACGLCAIILTMSFVSAMLAIVGDLFSINRKILEEIQFEIRQNKYKK